MKRFTLFILMFCFLALGVIRCGEGQIPENQSIEARVGKWSDVIELQVLPMHAHLLPNGKMLFWSLKDGLSKIFSFDPISNESKLMFQIEDIACSSHSFLADGRLLIAGGDGDAVSGSKKAFIYDYKTNVFKRVDDMNDGRWYATNVTLGNGNVLVISGVKAFTTSLGFDRYIINQEPQVLDVNSNSWKNLPNLKREWPWYPNAHLMPDGRIFISGPEKETFFIDVTGNGSLTQGPARGSFSRYGNSVLYNNKIIFIGGKESESNDDQEINVLSKVEIIDFNSPQPTWREIKSLSRPRVHQNTTILPTGELLVTGGSENSKAIQNPSEKSVLEGELFDPNSETWKKVAPQKIARMYHSVALLLPDGRVLSGGGWYGSDLAHLNSNPNAEIFSPPYLFWGPRPVISSGPDRATWGEKITIETAEANNIERVTLIRNSSVTHSNNMDQRFSELEFTIVPDENGLSVTIPSNSNVVPPGPYMLFILNQKGVPSEAKMMLIN